MLWLDAAVAQDFGSGCIQLEASAARFRRHQAVCELSKSRATWKFQPRPPPLEARNQVPFHAPSGLGANLVPLRSFASLCLVQPTDTLASTVRSVPSAVTFAAAAKPSSNAPPSPSTSVCTRESVRMSASRAARHCKLHNAYSAATSWPSDPEADVTMIRSLKLGFELARTPQEDPHRSTPIQVSSASRSLKRGCISNRVRQESDLVLIAIDTGLWKVVLPQDYTHQAHASQPRRRRRHIHGHRPHSEHPQQLVLGRAQCAPAARTLHIPARTRAPLFRRRQGRGRWCPRRPRVRLRHAARRVRGNVVQRASDVVVRFLQHELGWL